MDKIGFTVDRSLSAEGTRLLGYMFFSYDLLVKAFGLPGEPGDNYKSDAEWRIKLKSGEVLCIYDYKSGKNYCGEGGLDVKDIKEWHVGGKNKSDYLKLIEMVKREYYELF